MAMHLRTNDTYVAAPKILIVDDENGLRSQLAFRFRMEGYQVLEAKSGNEAQRIVTGEVPQLVLTDIRMADGSGSELIEWACTKFGSDRAPAFVCMTGHSDFQRVEAYQKRVSAYFSKPFDMEELVQACNHFTSEKMVKENLRKVASLTESERDLLRDSAAILMHEINNPLTTIQFALEHVKKIGEAHGGFLTEPPTKGRIDRAISSSQFIGRNLQGIRILFKNEIDPESVESVDIERMMKRAVSLVYVKGHEGAEHLVDLQVDRKAATIETSGEALEIIFCNLVRNAIQATPDLLDGGSDGTSDKAPVLVRVGEEKSDPSMIRISVVNNGPGVPPAMIEKLFELRSTTKGSSGSGIGLTVSYLLTKRLGGNLSLVSAKNPTEFVLNLPRK